MPVGSYDDPGGLVAQRIDDKQALAPLDLLAASKACFLRTGGRVFTLYVSTITTLGQTFFSLTR